MHRRVGVILLTMAMAFYAGHFAHLLHVKVDHADDAHARPGHPAGDAAADGFHLQQDASHERCDRCLELAVLVVAPDAPAAAADLTPAPDVPTSGAPADPASVTSILPPARAPPLCQRVC